MSHWYNPIVIALLRSPLHSLMSRSTLLITFTGRKSGKTYTFPISYGLESEDLLLITDRRKTWWKNLRGGVPVHLRVLGRDFTGRATLCESETPSLTAIQTVYRGIPRGQAERLAPDMMVVRIKPNSETPRS